MAEFSDDELREAAAEAGISPQELRRALAEREAGPTAKTTALARSPTAPPPSLSGTVAAAPARATAAIRAAIEAETGLRGHAQGQDAADVVDDDRGITYRVTSESDGAGGALVRVDVDPAAGKSAQMLATGGVVGVTTALAMVAWLFGVVTLGIGAVGLGVIGAIVLARNRFRLHHATVRAQAIAASAITDAEERHERPQALPPTRS